MVKPFKYSRYSYLKVFDPTPVDCLSKFEPIANVNSWMDYPYACLGGKFAQVSVEQINNSVNRHEMSA